MTTHGTRILAGSLLVANGITEEHAETILRSFTAADLDIVKRPPAEPQTGPKAEEQTPDYVKARTRIQQAVRTGPKCAGCGLNAHPDLGGDGNYCRLCRRATIDTEETAWLLSRTVTTTSWERVAEDDQ